MNGENLKTLRLKITSDSFVELGLQPICTDEDHVLVARHDKGVEYKFGTLSFDNHDRGKELFLYFLPFGDPARLNIVEINEYGDTVSNENKKRYSFRLKTTLDDKNLGEIKYETNNYYQGFMNLFRKTSVALGENKIEKGEFLPTLISESMKSFDAQKALVRATEFDGPFDISFFIELPENESFDKKKLFFVCVDGSYANLSSVLSERVAGQQLLLNMIVYDNVMYFSGQENTLLDGGYLDMIYDQYNYVNLNLENCDEI